MSRKRDKKRKQRLAARTDKTRQAVIGTIASISDGASIDEAADVSNEASSKRTALSETAARKGVVRNQFISSEIEGVESTEDQSARRSRDGNAADAIVAPLLPALPASLVGFVNFDGRSGDGNVSEVVVDKPFIESFRRGRYVEIENHGRAARYLGRIVEGPYYCPDFVGLDSSIARVAIQKAATISMIPDYHAYASVEVLGEIQGDALLGLTTRPLPKSRVNSVDGSRLTSLLRIDGDLHIGRLDGYDNIEVCMRSEAKHVLPRNVGIFGTVGSGKTNTSQVLIEQLSAAGWAVVVLDVEGEYTQMDRASTELLERLKGVGKVAKGLADFRVLHPIGAEPEEGDSSSHPFAVNFGGLPASMIAELVGMNDAQQERFFQLYDACARENLFGPVNTASKSTPQKTVRRRGRPPKKASWGRQAVSPRKRPMIARRVRLAPTTR